MAITIILFVNISAPCARIISAASIFLSTFHHVVNTLNDYCCFDNVAKSHILKQLKVLLLFYAYKDNIYLCSQSA